MNIEEEEEDLLIERYLNNQTSKEERLFVEKKMNADSVFKEKILFEKQLHDTLNEDTWSFIENTNTAEVKDYETQFKSNDASKIKDSIHKASISYQRKKNILKIRKIITLSSAAIIILMLSFHTYLTPSKTLPNLYSYHIKNTELPSVKNRGNDDQYNNLLRAQNLFENKAYKKSIIIFSKAKIQNKKNATIYLYIAIAQMELNELIDAESTLNNLINSNLIDAEKGYWFKSLLHLKSNDLEKAKSTLKIIIDNSYYNFDKSKQLLREISDLE